MKLSEAMRAGAKLVPQIHGRMFDYQAVPINPPKPDYRRFICGACALGLAYIGARPEAVEEAVSIGVASIELDNIWPELLNKHDTYGTVSDLIIVMNDNQRLPVEYIAARLESIGL